MDVGARLRPRDPAARPVGQGDASVERDRQLERDVRAPEMRAHQIACEAFPGCGMIDQRGLDPRRAHSFKALSRRARIGIAAADDGARDSALREQRGAGRPARRQMRARFERYVERRSFRGGSGLIQRNRFGMGPSPGLRPAASDHAAILDDQRADRRIGARERASAQRQPRCRVEPAPVLRRGQIIRRRFQNRLRLGSGKGCPPLPRGVRGALPAGRDRRRSRLPSRRHRGRSHARACDTCRAPLPRARPVPRGSGPAISGWQGWRRRSPSPSVLRRRSR